ncbi:hypothetical protein AX769_01090 [Frondihabitans sp. PAMC 28766]|nr:hypothetical protein AX769_01090 [Frondihabitans sp. PAMC 28766]
MSEEAFTESASRDVATIFAEADHEHASAIESAIDPTGLDLPKVALSIVKRSAKSVSFAKPKSMTDLHNALLTLRVLGHWDVVLPVVQRIASVPFLGWGYFDTQRGIVHEARWYAMRSGAASISEALAKNVYEPADWVPDVRDGDTAGFARPLDDPRLRGPLGLDPAYDGLKATPGERPQFFFQDLFQLALIWACGGSPVWPMDRLEHERARLEAGLLALPGMSP